MSFPPSHGRRGHSPPRPASFELPASGISYRTTQLSPPSLLPRPSTAPPPLFDPFCGNPSPSSPSHSLSSFPCQGQRCVINREQSDPSRCRPISLPSASECYGATFSAPSFDGHAVCTHRRTGATQLGPTTAWLSATICTRTGGAAVTATDSSPQTTLPEGVGHPARGESATASTLPALVSSASTFAWNGVHREIVAMWNPLTAGAAISPTATNHEAQPVLDATIVRDNERVSPKTSNTVMPGAGEAASIRMWAQGAFLHTEHSRFEAGLRRPCIVAEDYPTLQASTTCHSGCQVPTLPPNRQQHASAAAQISPGLCRTSPSVHLAGGLSPSISAPECRFAPFHLQYLQSQSAASNLTMIGKEEPLSLTTTLATPGAAVHIATAPSSPSDTLLPNQWAPNQPRRCPSLPPPTPAAEDCEFERDHIANPVVETADATRRSGMLFRRNLLVHGATADRTGWTSQGFCRGDDDRWSAGAADPDEPDFRKNALIVARAESHLPVEPAQILAQPSDHNLPERYQTLQRHQHEGPENSDLGSGHMILPLQGNDVEIENDDDENFEDHFAEDDGEIDYEPADDHVEFRGSCQSPDRLVQNHRFRKGGKKTANTEFANAIVGIRMDGQGNFDINDDDDDEDEDDDDDMAGASASIANEEDEDQQEDRLSSPHSAYHHGGGHHTTGGHRVPPAPRLLPTSPVGGGKGKRGCRHPALAPGGESGCDKPRRQHGVSQVAEESPPMVVAAGADLPFFCGFAGRQRLVDHWISCLTRGHSAGSAIDSWRNLQGLKSPVDQALTDMIRVAIMPPIVDETPHQPGRGVFSGSSKVGGSLGEVDDTPRTSESRGDAFRFESPDRPGRQLLLSNMPSGPPYVASARQLPHSVIYVKLVQHLKLKFQGLIQRIEREYLDAHTSSKSMLRMPPDKRDAASRVLRNVIQQLTSCASSMLQLIDMDTVSQLFAHLTRLIARAGDVYCKLTPAIKTVSTLSSGGGSGTGSGVGAAGAANFPLGGGTGGGQRSHIQRSSVSAAAAAATGNAFGTAAMIGSQVGSVTAATNTQQFLSALAGGLDSIPTSGISGASTAGLVGVERSMSTSHRHHRCPCPLVVLTRRNHAPGDNAAATAANRTLAAFSRMSLVGEERQWAVGKVGPFISHAVENGGLRRSSPLMISRRGDEADIDDRDSENTVMEEVLPSSQRIRGHSPLHRAGVAAATHRRSFSEETAGDGSAAIAGDGGPYPLVYPRSDSASEGALFGRVEQQFGTERGGRASGVYHPETAWAPGRWSTTETPSAAIPAVTSRAGTGGGFGGGGGGTKHLEDLQACSRRLLSITGTACRCSNHLPEELTTRLATGYPMAFIQQHAENPAVASLPVQQTWLTGRPDRLFLFLFWLILENHVRALPEAEGLEEGQVFDETAVTDGAKLLSGWALERLEWLAEVVGGCASLYHLVRYMFFLLYRLSCTPPSQTVREELGTSLAMIAARVANESPPPIQSEFLKESPVPVAEVLKPHLKEEVRSIVGLMLAGLGQALPQIHTSPTQNANPLSSASKEVSGKTRIVSSEISSNAAAITGFEAGLAFDGDSRSRGVDTRPGGDKPPAEAVTSAPMQNIAFPPTQLISTQDASIATLRMQFSAAVQRRGVLDVHTCEHPVASTLISLGDALTRQQLLIATAAAGSGTASAGGGGAGGLPVTAGPSAAGVTGGSSRMGSTMLGPVAATTAPTAASSPARGAVPARVLRDPAPLRVNTISTAQIKEIFIHRLQMAPMPFPLPSFSSGTSGAMAGDTKLAKLAAHTEFWDIMLLLDCPVIMQALAVTILESHMQALGGLRLDYSRADSDSLIGWLVLGGVAPYLAANVPSRGCPAWLAIRNFADKVGTYGTPPRATGSISTQPHGKKDLDEGRIWRGDTGEEEEEVKNTRNEKEDQGATRGEASVGAITTESAASVASWSRGVDPEAAARELFGDEIVTEPISFGTIGSKPSTDQNFSVNSTSHQFGGVLPVTTTGPRRRSSFSSGLVSGVSNLDLVAFEKLINFVLQRRGGAGGAGVTTTGSGGSQSGQGAISKTSGSTDRVATPRMSPLGAAAEVSATTSTGGSNSMNALEQILRSVAPATWVRTLQSLWPVPSVPVASPGASGDSRGTDGPASSCIIPPLLPGRDLEDSMAPVVATMNFCLHVERVFAAVEMTDASETQGRSTIRSHLFALHQQVKLVLDTALELTSSPAPPSATSASASSTIRSSRACTPMARNATARGFAGASGSENISSQDATVAVESTGAGVPPTGAGHTTSPANTVQRGQDLTPTPAVSPSSAATQVKVQVSAVLCRTLLTALFDMLVDALVVGDFATQLTESATQRLLRHPACYHALMPFLLSEFRSPRFLAYGNDHLPNAVICSLAKLRLRDFHLAAASGRLHVSATNQVLIRLGDVLQPHKAQLTDFVFRWAAVLSGSPGRIQGSSSVQQPGPSNAFAARGSFSLGPSIAPDQHPHIGTMAPAGGPVVRGHLPPQPPTEGKYKPRLATGSQGHQHHRSHSHHHHRAATSRHSSASTETGGPTAAAPILLGGSGSAAGSSQALPPCPFSFRRWVLLRRLRRQVAPRGQQLFWLGQEEQARLVHVSAFRTERRSHSLVRLRAVADLLKYNSGRDIQAAVNPPDRGIWAWMTVVLHEMRVRGAAAPLSLTAGSAQPEPPPQMLTSLAQGEGVPMESSGLRHDGYKIASTVGEARSSKTLQSRTLCCG